MKPFRFAISLILFLQLTSLVTEASEDSLVRNPKIVGGTNAPVGEYPWMVALVRPGNGNLRNRHFCGGSLVHPSWVMTAAHCVDDITEGGLQAVVNISNLGVEAGSITRSIKGIYIHPGYEVVEGDYLNDVALLLLDSPVNTVAPVAFAINPRSAPPKSIVRAIGWGDTRATPRFPTQLQMVDLVVENLKNTQIMYGGGRLDIRHIAAISPGKDTCQGDSGGPLFLSGGAGGNPLVVGITSYGIGCAQPDIAGLYANVGYFGGWVNAFLNQPSGSDPEVAILGNGTEIINGSVTTSIINGTVFKNNRRVRAGRTASRSFAITNPAGSLPLSVASIQSDLDDFSIVSKPNYVFGGSSATFTIRYRAPFAFRKGATNGTITVRTNDPTNALFTFKLLGRHQKAR